MVERVAPSDEIEAVKAELALYRDAVESMHQGVCMYDAEGRITVVNRRYAEQLRLPVECVQPGMTAAEVLQTCIDAGHYPGLTSEQVFAQVRAKIAPEVSLATMVRGERSYAMRRCPTAAGNLLTTCEDMTAQAEAESALRDSEARLQAILDAMPDCVKIFDEPGRLIQINPQGLDLLQAPDLESLSAPGYMAVPDEYREACLDVHQRVMDGESVVWTYEVIGLKGRRRHVEAHAVPFRMPDGAKVHLCISRDVEERLQAHEAVRRSEERLRLVQETTGLADFVATPDRITQISDALIEQTGLPPGTTSLTFGQWMKIVHPDDRELFARNMMTNVGQDADTVQCEFRIVRPDNGEVRWIYSRTRLDRNTSGQTFAYLGAHLDVTERKL